MKSVIIGSGYIGLALGNAWQGHELILTTTQESKLEQIHTIAKGYVVKGDEEAKLKQILVGADRIVVCIAPKDGNYEQTYLKTAQTITKVMPKTAHLLYTSSTSVYGEWNGDWVTEESTLKGNPILIETEKVYLTLPKVTILRLAGIFGPDRELEKHAKYFAGKTQSDSYCNWVHQEDIISAINWCFEKELLGIYNLCSDQHPKRSELYPPLLKALNLPPIIWQEGPSLYGNKRVACDKIKATGFAFHHGLLTKTASD